MTSAALIEVSQAVEVVVRASPFRTETTRLFAPPGFTIRELVDQAMPDKFLRRLAQAWLVDDDGDPQPIPTAIWHRVRPKPGVRLFLAPVPRGGNSNKILSAVIMIAVVAAASAFLGPSAFMAGGWAVGGAGAAGFSASTASALSAIAIGVTVGIAGMLVSALLPIAGPRLGELGGYSGSGGVSPSLTGSSNAARPWYPIPRVYGRLRMTPPKAARDVTESEGETVWLRCLFEFGYGPLELSDMRIGSIPIEQFEGVDIEVRQGFDADDPITLYTANIRTDSYNLKVTNVGGPQIIESRDNAIELGLDITFNGLIGYLTAGSDAGKPFSLSIGLRLEYRLVGETGWTPWADDVVTAQTPSSYTRSWRAVVPQGRYQVRVTRTGQDITAPNARGDSFITQLRTVQPGPPTHTTGRCMVALRIKASDQLNGTIQEFSAIAQALLPVWDGTSWTLQATRTPAWAYLDVLRGSANRFPVSDSRLQLADFLAWAGRSNAVQPDGGPKHTFDAAIDSPSTVFETLRDIAAAGRAAPSMRDGKFSVVEDIPQTVAIQHFTPRNSWGFSGSKVFVEPWHGVRVRYTEPDRDWQQSEVVVYADGYTEANATRVDTLEIRGITRKVQAMREGRYHLASVTLRPETYELSCDIENLLCTRGDLVRVSHDVPLWGSGWARVKAIATDAGDVVGFTLDDTIPIAPDKLYAVRWRAADATGGVASVSAVAGDTRVFTLLVPLPPEAAPAIGDLAMVGEANRESAPLIVKSIAPGPNLSAKITLVDAAEAVHSADAGAIPAFDPLITLPYDPPRTTPLAPVVLEIFSGNAALLRGSDGTILARIGARLRAAAGDLAPAVFQMRYRLAGATDWEVAQGPGPIVFSAPVQEAEAYQVQLRAVTALGLAGPWTDQVTHLVEGKLAPPGDVANFMITGRRLDWSDNTDLDLAGYRIRWAPGNSVAWGTATPAHGGLLTASPFVLDALPAGTVTIMIKAVDASGNESATAARIVTDLGDAAIAGTEAAAVDFRGLGFAGTKTDCTVVSSDLLADADGSAAMWTAGAAPMWGDAATEMFPGAGYVAMAYEDDLFFSDPPPGSRVLLRHTIEGDGARILYRVVPSMWGTSGDPMWTADGDPMFGAGVTAEWLAWPGSLVNPPEALQLRVEIDGGGNRGAIRRLVAALDAPRIDEALADVALASGGTRLPIAQAYRAISAVQVTLQGGTTALSVKIIDKDPDDGPLIRAFDASGTGVAATVDARITGY